MKQEVNITAFKNGLLTILKNDVDKLAKQVSLSLVDIMRRRTEEGYDIYGRKFGGYNLSYNKTRAMKYAVRKYGKTTYQGSTNVSGKTTPLRLTGHLFSAMDCKVLQAGINGNRLSMKFRIYINDPSQAGKVEGLLSDTGTARNGQTYSKKSWEFLGLSITGSRVNQERQVINQILRKYFTNLSIKAR